MNRDGSRQKGRTEEFAFEGNAMWSIQDSKNTAAGIMFSGGALASYHEHISSQLGTMTNPPPSPLGTSSSQVRTAPFLVSSRRTDIPASDPASPEARFRSSPMSIEARQQMLYHGPSLGSHQSGGAETTNTHSSGTSGGSSHDQISNDERRTRGPDKDNFCCSHLHKSSSTFAGITSTKHGSGPSNEAKDWDGIVQERSTMHPSKHLQVERNENLLESDSQEPCSSMADHDEFENCDPSGHISSRLDKSTGKEGQILNPEPVDSSSGSDRVNRKGTATQSNDPEIFPVYSTSLMSSDVYNFPTGAELLAVPARSSSHPSRGSAPTVVDDESTFGSIVGFSPNQSVLGRVYPSPMSLKVNWASIASQYVGNSLLDNNVHNSLPGMIPMTGSGTTVSTFLSENLEVQDNSTTQGNQSRDGTVISYISTSYGERSSETSAELLMSNSGAGHLNIQSQDRFLSTALPQVALAQSTSVERSHLTSFGSDDVRLLPLDSLAGSLVAGNAGQNKWRNGGNELLFLPGSDTTGHTQPCTGQQAHQLRQPEIIGNGSRRSPPSRGQVNAHALYQSSYGQSPTGVGNYQSLSLSLSSQQPSTLQLHPSHGKAEADADAFAYQGEIGAKGKKSLEYSEGRYNGILSRFRPQGDDLTTTVQDPHTCGPPAERKHQRLVYYSEYPCLVSSSNSIYGCKYLKLSQILLNEICIVRKREKRATNQDYQTAKQWTTSGPTSVSVSNSLTSFHTREVRMGNPTLKDYMISASSLPATSTVTEPRGGETIFDIQSENREELDQKRRRLTTYVIEVDRRYMSYGEHMMDIINHFNSIAGPGAATPYTALALQAMSRHFRCLKDAVSVQLRSVKRILGEQDSTTVGYAAREEISNLRFVDQQLRQQRALQQLGMLQQHAWRPQRGLPERAVSVLRSWLFEHFLHPYPKDSDKLLLAKQTGLTRNQVSNWFINARVRLWKPMVEEMYLEEFNNSDEGGSGEGNLQRERRGNDGKDYTDGNLASSFSQMDKGIGKQRIMIDAGGDGTFPHSDLSRSHGMHHIGLNSISTNFDVAIEKGSMTKKARSGVHNSDSLPCSMVGLDIDSGDASHCQDSRRLVDGHHGRPSDQTYGQHQNTLMSSGERFGRFICGNLSGFPANFGCKPPSSANGVSLTLGLRHSDGLSLSATVPLRKNSANGQLYSSHGLKDHRLSGVEENAARSMNKDVSISHSNVGYESLKKRHPFPEHIAPEYRSQG